MERVEAILNNPCFLRWMEQNAQKEARRKFCSHDMQHIIDVARIMYILFLEAGDLEHLVREFDLAAEGQAKEIIYAAALLHDVGRWKEYETGEDHASLGSEMAKPVLKEAGFSDLEIRGITAAIRQHRKMEEAGSLLEQRLYRADKLARPCLRCLAGPECYKIEQMETGKKAIIY